MYEILMQWGARFGLSSLRRMVQDLQRRMRDGLPGWQIDPPRFLPISVSVPIRRTRRLRIGGGS